MYRYSIILTVNGHIFPVGCSNYMVMFVFEEFYTSLRIPYSIEAGRIDLGIKNHRSELLKVSNQLLRWR